ncbi:MAG: ATP-grasp domain-containing protein [Simkaniaceae bacterium]|nr:ATP-grasp domain-containing protein [Simkaniaceae bacterium]
MRPWILGIVTMCMGLIKAHAEIKTTEKKIAVAVIVDAYSSANQYAESFYRKNLACIHVQSTPLLLPVFQGSFQPNLYIDCQVYEGDFESLVKNLSKYDVRCVIAGVEPGVELADRLSETLHLRTNGTELSAGRRNKYAMGKLVQAAGLPSPKFCKVSDWNTLTEWQTQENTSYPLVLKPLDSGGTDGVYICSNKDELLTAFHKVVGSINVLGHCNREILVQTFLKGDEYVVNSVSLDGEAYIVAILKSTKRFLPGHGFIYDREVMMEREGPTQKALASMHEKVLKALKIDHGPAHGEYMMTEEGPILIEVASRISGGIHKKANDLSVGCNQVDLTVDAYVDQKAFLEKTKAPYQRKNHFYQVLLSTNKTGTLHGTDQFLEEIRKLPSYCDMKLKIKEGMIIHPTVDLISALGSVFLVHENQEVIELDYKKICNLVDQLIPFQEEK